MFRETLADASISLNIVGKGDTKLLSGVLYVPKMSYGLISVSRLERKDKAWAFRAEPCRMLGYSEDGKHTYIVLNVRTGRIVWDRADVVFDESFYSDGLFPSFEDGDIDSDFGCEETANCLEDLRHMWLSASASAALAIPPLPYSPASVDEALAGPDSLLWIAAIKKELENMERLGVMEYAQQQEGHGMKMKMILKTAYNNDFSV
ncbi:hypothetical protein B484DRAFT_399104 [Ochromonadaceae sp. CCMP2298]|nr:hypothetical protein B484DRAFT_399104 [Ochromonadaceae sp. CCMP2298]